MKFSIPNQRVSCKVLNSMFAEHFYYYYCNYTHCDACIVPEMCQKVCMFFVQGNFEYMPTIDHFHARAKEFVTYDIISGDMLLIVFIGCGSCSTTCTRGVSLLMHRCELIVTVTRSFLPFCTLAYRLDSLASLTIYIDTRL